MAANHRGAGNIKALFASALTVAVMYMIMDIRGFREPEWLKSKKPAPAQGVNLQKPEAIIGALKDKIESIRERAKGGPAEVVSSGAEIDRGEVEKFFETEEAAKLIPHPATHYGAAWYFLKPEWLDRDVVKVAYEDGNRKEHMVLKVSGMSGRKPELKILWDSWGQ
ncbi:MAG: hypothetical protein HYT87_05315 [Nitrospirae bacterium]|nr:hypothetical protein [Nitrospirota bacterium]